VPLLAFSIPLVPHLLSTWALTMVDRWLLVELVGRTELGLYTAAYFFPVVINVLSMSGYRAWSPTFHKQIHDPTKRETIRRSTTWFTVAVLVAAVGAASVGPETALALFDDRYAKAADLVRLLALGAGFQGLYYVYVAALYNRKRKLAIPAATVLAAGVNVGLNLWWIPTHGAAGAAAATAVSYGVLTGVVFFASRRVLKVPIDVRLLGLSCGLLVVAFGLAELAAPALLSAVEFAPRWEAGMGVVIRGAVFAAVLVPTLPRLRR
jgi:O-antigen/teichoic acid export membrane protein